MPEIHSQSLVPMAKPVQRRRFGNSEETGKASRKKNPVTWMVMGPSRENQSSEFPFEIIGHSQ